MGVDYIALLFVGFACLFLSQGAGGTPSSRLWLAPLTATTIAIMCWSRGIYSDASHRFAKFQPGLLLLAWLEGCGVSLLTAQGIVMLTALHADQAAWNHFVPAPPPVGLMIGELVALLSSRYVTAALATRSATPIRAAIIGTNRVAHTLAGQLRSERHRRWDIVAWADMHSIGAEPRFGVDWSELIRESLDEVLQEVRRGTIDTVFLALPDLDAARRRELYRLLRPFPIDIYAVSDVAFDEAISLTSAALPLTPISRRPMAGWQEVAKRAEDVIIAGALVVLTAPALLTIAALVKLTSPGPVLFKQRRVGLNGQHIMVYKFRSMYTHLTDDHASQQTVRNDIRVTRIGAWLRRSSLDELPQLLNVLRGDMSIVGPRPHALMTTAGGLPLDQAAPDYQCRHRVKPGITGWAQVNGYRGVLDSVEKIVRRVDHDLYYIENWSLRLDLVILWRTARLLLNDRNAF